MERYTFLALYIRLAQLLAAILLVVGLIQAFQVLEIGFWPFVVAVIAAAGSAFMILVGADVAACFLAIEENTRRSKE
jgi:predicted nicotinamide N-methyase